MIFNADLPLLGWPLPLGASAARKGGKPLQNRRQEEKKKKSAHMWSVGIDTT